MDSRKSARPKKPSAKVAGEFQIEGNYKYFSLKLVRNVAS
jgi:hypothetical protein